jgi:RNA polymerase sigma-70 factor, ECF subfamily
MSTTAAADGDRFTSLFDEYAPRVFGYVRRHLEREGVEDVVAETFLIAWRRLADVPADPLPWLLVVARNTMANQRRSAARHDRALSEVALRGRLSQASSNSAPEDLVVTRSTMVAALATLTATEREALLLTAWDGLGDVDAARVAGCSPRAFRVRLHRARRRFDRTLDAKASDDPQPRRPIAILKETT